MQPASADPEAQAPDLDLDRSASLQHSFIGRSSARRTSSGSQ
jgi:hypothetical protein